MYDFQYLLGPKCATGVVLPKDYLTSSDSSYLPGFGPSAPAPSKLSWVPLAAGAVLIGGVLYLVAKGAAPVLANPGRANGRWVWTAFDTEYAGSTDTSSFYATKKEAIAAAKKAFPDLHQEGDIYVGSEYGWIEVYEADWAANPGLPDGVAKREGFTARDADPRELARGTKHEMEHTRSKRIARQIALDHLAEDAHYYQKLERMERRHG